MLLARLRVVKHEMALRERAALRVLAGQPDRDALGQQRRERQRLGMRPHDPGLGPAHPERLAPLIELLDELRVHGEPVRHGQELLVEHLEPVGGDRRLDLGRGGAVELVLAGGVLDLLGLLDLGLELLVILGQHGPDPIGHLGRLLLGDDPLLDQAAWRTARARADAS